MIKKLLACVREYKTASLLAPVYVTAVNQSARVEIDEKGVKAAAYIEIPMAGAAEPPEEIKSSICWQCSSVIFSEPNKRRVLLYFNCSKILSSLI